MGAGQFNAGEGLGGEDPLADPSPPRDVTPPAALLFDGATKAHPLDAQGRYQGIHPVDQRVALALLVRFGSVGSVPDQGARFREIAKVTRYTAAQAKDMVNLALARLLAAKDITVELVEVETNRLAGSIAIAVSYQNLRLPKQTKPNRVVIRGA
jgi:hypothetical protein